MNTPTNQVSEEQIQEMKTKAEELIKKSKELHPIFSYDFEKPNKTVNVGLYLNSADANMIPQYATKGSSGMDVRANIENDVEIPAGDRVIIPTGVFVKLPEGYEIQLRPRSGLAAKKGLTLLNCVGTIDEDYRGEIGCILINLSKETQIIQKGDRIAQIVIAKVDRIEWLHIDKEELEKNQTERNDKGYGSTGIN